MALVIAFMLMLLLAALGASLAILSMGETRLAAVHRSDYEARYAADAGVEVVLSHLASVPDWKPLTSGALSCPYTDGPPGVRATVAGPVDLAAATAAVRSTPNAPGWQLCAFGPLGTFVPAQAGESHVYLIVWVAPHPIGGGQDYAALLAHAYGPSGVRRGVEVMASRAPPGVRVLSWREVP